jgi:hypothetical protein
MSKNVHMTPLIFGQSQDPCDAVENGRGYLLAAPLFQVRVPGGAYAGENRDLLAPQPRRSAPASDGETHFPRVYLLTPGAQKPRKLSLTTRCVCHGCLRVARGLLTAPAHGDTEPSPSKPHARGAYEPRMLHLTATLYRAPHVE